MRTTSSRAGASALSGATRPFMRGSIAAATSRPPQPQRSKQRRNSSASLVTASNGPAPERTWWTFTRGPSLQDGPLVAGLALEAVDAVLELPDEDGELDVEARLLGEDLAVVLAQ